MEKPFCKKKTQTNPLKPVSDAFYHGKYRACIEEAEKLFSHKDETVMWNAKRFSGLANYRLKRFLAATQLFQSIAQHSNNTDDWFNLMTAAVRNNQIELGEQAYDNFNKSEVIKGDNHMLTYANVTYQLMIAFQDVKAYSKALEKLIVLKRYIAQVKHHNSEFLAQHGVPFIFQTLVSGKETLEHEYSSKQIHAFLDDFAKQVDADGKESIEEFRMQLAKR